MSIIGIASPIGLLNPFSLLIGLFLVTVLAYGAERAWQSLGAPGKQQPLDLLAAPSAFHKKNLLAWPQSIAGSLTVLFITFGLVDGLLLAALPILGLSFGRIEMSWFGITVVRQVIFIAIGVSWSLSSHFFPALRTQTALHNGVYLLWAVNLFVFTCEVRGLYMEPFDLHQTTLAVSGPALAKDRPLRLLHLSDIHLERITRREQDMLTYIERLQPDLITISGDYFNLDYKHDPVTWAQTRQVLSQLHAPLGVYAVTGTPAVDIPEAVNAVFSNLDNITLLQDEVHTFTVGSTRVNLIGKTNRYDSKCMIARCQGYTNTAEKNDANLWSQLPNSSWLPQEASITENNDANMLARMAATLPENDYNILVYHTPDLAYVATENGIDLYLGGHTHGGQIRLPFIGAIVTGSIYGKRFEAGHYQIDGMDMYISRGIGMEGAFYPRARFLCPPELVLVELGPGTLPP